MNLLAIDHGTKNIGLAWAQPEMGVVLPYGVVKNSTELADLVEVEKIDKLIVGLPIGLDGKENNNTKRVKDFVAELKQIIKIPIEFFDERFTSAEADRMGGEATRDEKAAMIILQSYLDNQKKLKI